MHNPVNQPNQNMNLLRQIFERFQFTRTESMALAMVFGLYVVGLTWSYVQKTSVPFDEEFYAKIDSATGEFALVPTSQPVTVAADTVPKHERADSVDTTLVTESSIRDGLQMDTGRLNVNKATERQLMLLPGIGPTLAQRIVDYRRASGPFSSPADLTKVKGIGPKTLARFEGMIVTEQ